MLNRKLLKIFYKICLLFFYNTNECLANRLIVKIETAPKKAIEGAKKDYLLGKPKEESKNLPTVLKTRPITSGIQINYAGFRRYTDRSGLATFPLAGVAKNIIIVIAPEIFPRVLSGTSVDHFALWQDKKPNNPNVALFEMRREKISDDEWTWTVEAKPVPEDGKIPNTAVIIQANPESIFVPTGKTTSKQKQQCLLPSIFLLDRTGIDELILDNFGKAKIDNNKNAHDAKYNLLENLKAQSKNANKDNLSIQITNLPESST